MDRAFTRLKQRTVEAIGKGGTASDSAADTTGDERVERMAQLRDGYEAVLKSGAEVMFSKRHQDLDRRKIPYTRLGEALQGAGAKATEKAPLLKQSLEDAGKLQMDLAAVLAQYEQELDTRFLQQTQNLVEKDIKGVLQERKELENLRLDRDAAKGRMVSALNNTPDKYAACEAQYAQMRDRYDLQQAGLSKAADDFWGREEELAGYLLELCELQMRTFEEAAKQARATVDYLRAALVTSNKVFKRNIDDYTAEKGVDVPEIVEHCIAAIDARGINEEGIFRMSGNQSTVRRLRQLFNSEDPSLDLMSPQWEGEHHAIAGVLKLYFRELPDPLLGGDLYDGWLEAMRLPDHNAKLYAIADMLARLPRARHCTLKAVVRFLCKVVQGADTNKMHASNLGIVFGPTLLRRHDVEDAASTIMDSGALASLAETLITYYAWLFADDSDPSVVTYAHFQPGIARTGPPPVAPRTPTPSVQAQSQQPDTIAPRKLSHTRSISSTLDIRKTHSLRADTVSSRQSRTSHDDLGTEADGFQRARSVGCVPGEVAQASYVAAPRPLSREGSSMAGPVPVPAARPRVSSRPARPTDSDIMAGLPDPQQRPRKAAPPPVPPRR